MVTLGPNTVPQDIVLVFHGTFTIEVVSSIWCQTVLNRFWTTGYDDQQGTAPEMVWKTVSYELAICVRVIKNNLQKKERKKDEKLQKKIQNEYIYIYAFSRNVYPKRLTVHSGYTFFVSMHVAWELNPQPFALLTQCSTTETQEHKQSKQSKQRDMKQRKKWRMEVRTKKKGRRKDKQTSKRK